MVTTSSRTPMMMTAVARSRPHTDLKQGLLPHISVASRITFGWMEVVVVVVLVTEVLVDVMVMVVVKVVKSITMMSAVSAEAAVCCLH